MLHKKISVAILGSTGSIGRTSLKVISQNSKYFKVDLLACKNNKANIDKQIKKFLPKFVIITNNKNYNFFKKKKFKKKIKFFNNLKDFEKNIKTKFDKVVLGISSIEGLDYAFSFIKYSKELLLANKETIVCGGKLFLKKALNYNCKIIPIDSEHFCLMNILKNIDHKLIDNVYLTASGGPFLNTKNSKLAKVKPSLALNHPVWKMGKKISIDSATMANKGLEVIEACILFNLNPNKIKIKIHKQSKVHAAVVLKNGIVFLVAHNTSMSIPIENSLLQSHQIAKKNNFFLQKDNFIFSFDEKKLLKFKMVSLAYKALNYGQRACIFYNVINDSLVHAYLDKKIFFFQIYDKLNFVLNNKKLTSYFRKKIKNINDIYQTISDAKNFFNKI